MAQLTYDQVKQLWIDAGGNPQVAPLAAGLAYGESGLRTDAVNPSSPDYGLWQLTYAGNLNADRTRKYGTPQQLMADPLAQARAVVAEYGSNLELVRTGFGGAPGQPETADTIYRVWQAWNGGTQQAPPDELVRRWIGSTLSSPASGGAAPSPADIAADGSTVVGATVSGPGGDGCNAGSKGSELPFVSGRIGSACQLKALSGGLLVGVGFSLFVTGAVLVAMSTRTGSKAVGAAAGLVPGGSALKSLGRGGSSRTRLPRITAETEAESRANYDARNPSPARQEATRRARSGNLGAMSYTMDDLASDLFRFE